MKIKKSLSFLVLLVFAVSAFVSVQVFQPKNTEAITQTVFDAIETFDCCTHYAAQCNGDVADLCFYDCMEQNDCQKQVQETEV